MMIVEAMRHSHSEAEILYLLTAYLETLQWYHVEKHLSPGVSALPLKGMADMAARYNQLLYAHCRCFLCAGSAPQSSIALEAMELFGVACDRLHELRRHSAASPGSVDGARLSLHEAI